MLTYRRQVLDLLFSERNHVCAVCVSNGHCELQWPVSYTHLDVYKRQGACGLAPVAVFDGNIAGKLDMGDALNRLQEMTAVPTEVESVREA